MSFFDNYFSKLDDQKKATERLLSKFDGEGDRFRKGQFFDKFKPTDAEGGADFVGPPKPEGPTTSVTTDESFRHVDDNRSKGLTAIIEGGLLAGQNKPVPAELAAFAGERGEQRDIRDKTDLVADVVPESSATEGTRRADRAIGIAGEGLQRIGAGLGRGIDWLEATQGSMLGGITPDERKRSPIRAVEDTAMVDPADTLAKQSLDFAGEVAPIALASIAGNVAGGGTAAVNAALKAGGSSTLRNWAARAGVEAVIGTAEGFASATVPLEHTPEVAAGTFIISGALSSIPIVGRNLAKGFHTDAVTKPLTRILGEMVVEGSERGLSKAAGEAGAENFARQVEFGDNFHRAPAFPGSVSRDAPAEGLQDAFTAKAKSIRQELTGSTETPIAVPSRELIPVDLAGARQTGADDLATIAEAKLIPFEQLEDGSFLVDGIAARTVQEAGEIIDNPSRRFNKQLSDSIRAYLGDETDEIVERASAQVAKGGPKAAQDYATHVAAAAQESGDAVASQIVKAASEMTDVDAARAMLIPEPNAILRGLRALGSLPEAPRSGSLFQQFYVNALLTNPGTHLTNIMSTAANLGVRTSDVATRGLIGTVSRQFERLGVDVAPELTSARISDVGPLIANYARGAKSYLDVMNQVGRNIRTSKGLASGLEGGGADTLAQNIHFDNSRWAERILNYYSVTKSLFSEGADDVNREMNEHLARKFGGNVDLGSIVSDFKAGGRGGNAFRKATSAPTQALQNADLFFKAMNFEGERAILMARHARMNNMTTEELANKLLTSQGDNVANLFARQDSIFSDLGQEINDMAAQRSKVNTFTNDLGELGKAVKGVRDVLNVPVAGTVLPLGTLLSPFVQTPMNVATYTIRHSPVGALWALGKLATNTPTEQVVKEFAEGVSGTALMAGAYYLMHEDRLVLGEQPGAASRTAELASGGQRVDGALRLNDGSLFNLRPLGPIGNIIVMSGEVMNRYGNAAEKALAEAEASFGRPGGATAEDLRLLRIEAAEHSMLKALTGNPFGLASSTLSTLSELPFTETSIGDSVSIMNNLMLYASGRRDEQSMVNLLQSKAASMAQPISLLNSFAQAEQGGEVRVPTDEAGFASGVGTKIAQRVPFLEPRQGQSVALRDVGGNKTLSRKGGDTGNVASRFLGAAGGEMAKVLLGSPEFVGDRARDQATRLGKEMQAVGLNKNFPIVSGTLDKKLNIPSVAEEQAQAYKGQRRVRDVLKRTETDGYRGLSKERKLEKLKKWLEEADRKSNAAIKKHFEKQHKNGETLDLGTASWADQFELPPITPQKRGDAASTFLGF